MELIQEEKIVKKPRRSRQVCEDEVQEYLRRPVQKIENLTENLMNSYEKPTYLRSRHKNSEENEKTKNQQQKSNQISQQQKNNEIDQQQNKQSIYHQSNSEKANQIVQKKKKQKAADPMEEMEESSITTSSHQQEEHENASKGQSQLSSEKINQNHRKNKSSSESQHQQQQQKNKQDKDYTPQEQDEKSNKADSKQQSSQMSYKRRRRSQAQMLLAHKIQVLKSFLNKKKYIRKKLRPKKLVGPPLSHQEQWKIDLQKYHKLRQLIRQEMNERKQMMEKIDAFGEQQHLKTIKVEEDILSGKRVRGQHSEENSQNNSRSSSLSSSSSSSKSRSSSKSNKKSKQKMKAKQEQQHKQILQKTEEKQEEEENDDELDSAEQICKGTKKDISHFKKLIDQNLDSLKPKPDRRRRRRRKFISNHRQYNYPKTRNKKQKVKEQPVKEQEKTSSKRQSTNVMKSRIKQQSQNKSKVKKEASNLGQKDQNSNRKVELPQKIHHLREKRLLQEEKRKVKQNNSQSQPLSQQKMERVKPKMPHKLWSAIEGESLTNKSVQLQNKSQQLSNSGPSKANNQIKSTVSNIQTRKSTRLKNQTNQLQISSSQKVQSNVPEKTKQEYYAEFINDKRKSLSLQPRLVLESMLFRIDKQTHIYSPERVEERSNDRDKSQRHKKKKHIKQVCTQSQSEELDYRNRHKMYGYEPKYSRKNKKYRKIIQEYTDSDNDQYEQYSAKPKVYRKVKHPHQPKKSIIQVDLNGHTDQQQINQNEKTIRRINAENNQD